MFGRKKDDDYFIGLEDDYGAEEKARTEEKKRNKKKLFKRVTISAVCVVAAVALVAVAYHLVVPGIGMLLSAVDPSTDAFAATADETATPDVPVTTETQAPTATTVAVTTPPATAAPDKTVDAFGHKIPVIKDNGKDGVRYSTTIYLWNSQGYNLFFSGNKAAKTYADTLNTLAKKLDSKIKIYSLVVPNHTEFGLPKRIIDSGIETDSQSENIKVINDNLSKRIKGIDCYDSLCAHADEYIYYHTDHHWTSLGAYYGYTAFCEQLGLTPIDISKLQKNTIDGFTGSFYTSTKSSDLLNNSDTVSYYTLKNKTTAYMKEKMSSDTLKVDVYYPASTGGQLTYGVFCWGDTAQFVIHSDCNTGRKIAVVKDSYGNAFAPYLTANYEEVHLIDYRYWSSDLNKYCESNGITEVLFLNNTMSANNNTQLNTMKNVFA